MILELENIPANFIYNSPYSPQHNPIEEFFGTIKAKIRSMNTREDHDIISMVLKTISEIDVNLISKYYLHFFLSLYTFACEL